jgi:hypothetical protein
MRALNKETSLKNNNHGARLETKQIRDVSDKFKFKAEIIYQYMKKISGAIAKQRWLKHQKEMESGLHGVWGVPGRK